MTLEPTLEEWRSVIYAAETPTAGQLPIDLADAFDVPDADARKVVDAALDSGTLIEEDTDGMFDELRVADGGILEDAEPDVDDAQSDGKGTNGDTPEDANRTADDDERYPYADVSGEGWDDADFSAPEAGVWALAWEDREFWMARKKNDKKPFAPGGDPNHPKGECSNEEHNAETTDECPCDARYKWSIPDNWAPKEKVDEWVEMDPNLGGHVALLEKEDDPYTDDPDPFAFVDGDDVRCPETGEVHPGFLAILKHLGFTYADISTSGGGVHALYRGTLPEGVKRLVFDLDSEPWGENDDPPGIEIYDGKRVCVVTGDHVAGTPLNVEPWDLAALEAIADANTDREDARGVSHDTDRDLDELEDYDPSATAAAEITQDIRDVFVAVDRLDTDDLPLQTRQVGTDGTGWEKWDPSSYRRSSGNDSLHTSDRKAWHDHKTGRSFGLMSLFAAEQGIISKPWHPLKGADWWETVDRARNRGAPIPRLDTTSDDSGGRYFEECAPPLSADADPIDIQARRGAMTSKLYDRSVDRDGLTVWAHNPGEGKTTSAAIAAAQRDREHVVLLPKHENCREFQRDDSKPDGYMHLKGAAQPVADECMDAGCAGEECDVHPDDCPTMCPVYSDPDVPDELRDAFSALSGSVGVQKAHELLELSDKEWHSDKCDWQTQWDLIDGTDRIVTVHNYTTLKSVHEHGDVVIDDLQGGLKDEGIVALSDLSLCATSLGRIAEFEEDKDVSLTLSKLSDFVETVVGELSDSRPREVALEDFDAPDFLAVYRREFDDRDTVPEDIPDEVIEDSRSREYVGEEDYYIFESSVTAPVRDLAETLAQAKQTYNQTLINRVRDGRGTNASFYFDVVLGVLAAAMDDEDARECRVAAGVPTVLENCPKCDSRLALKNGAQLCTESGCGWHEDESRLTFGVEAPARIVTQPAAGPDGIHGIATTRYPTPDELPEPNRVLALDATPRRRELAAVFGTAPEDVAIDGDESYALPHTTVTQITDGAYHRSTLTTSETAQARAQAAIDRVADMHDDVIYVALKKVREHFEWSDDAEVLDYYALRGLDRPGADAVVCVGAPHPAEDDLMAEARALSVGAPDVRVGGRELSTRNRDPSDSEDAKDDVGEPVYRKLNYTDAGERGRAVASKTYTGLVGELFDGRHGDEIEQAAHRHRPILATEAEPKHVYLLTNVATELPVDRLTGYDAFLNPTEAHIDVRESALELLDTMVDVAQDEETDRQYVTDGGSFDVKGTVAEWHDAAQNGGMDVSERTIRNALADLTDVGLVKEGTYRQHRGRFKTLTTLGARVACR